MKVEVQLLLEDLFPFFPLKSRLFRQPPRVDIRQPSRIRVEQSLSLEKRPSFADKNKFSRSRSHHLQIFSHLFRLNMFQSWYKMGFLHRNPLFPPLNNNKIIQPQYIDNCLRILTNQRSYDHHTSLPKKVTRKKRINNLLAIVFISNLEERRNLPFVFQILWSCLDGIVKTKIMQTVTCNIFAQKIGHLMVRHEIKDFL